MKTLTPLPLLSLVLSITLRLNAQPFMVLQPHADPEIPEASRRVVWSTDPGIRYELQRSSDLRDPDAWETLDGYPSEAAALAQQELLAPDESDRDFYRVVQLDEQPPRVVAKRPSNNGYGVRRFSTITVELDDLTGVDPATISLTVGEHGPYTVAEPELDFEDGLLSFWLGGDTALGHWEGTIDVSLAVADILGNQTQIDWSFDLEVAPEVVDNLFVFGSPDARGAGQEIDQIPTRILSDRMLEGPIRMNENTDSWVLEHVETDRLIIHYTGDEPPVFQEGDYLSNLTPANINDLFYRRVESILHDADNKELTLMTEEVDLEDIVMSGTLSSDSSDVFFVVGENGVIERAVFAVDLELDPIGFSMDGWTFNLENKDGFDIVSLYTEKLHWWLTPGFSTTIDIGNTGLRRFDAVLSGQIYSAAVFDLSVLLLGVSGEKVIYEIPQHQKPGFWVPLGSIGPVPVSAKVEFGLDVTAGAEANAYLDFKTGVESSANTSFGIDYKRGRSPSVEWIRTFDFNATHVPLTVELDGKLDLGLEVKPTLSFLVYGLAGLQAGIAPKTGLRIQDDGTGGISGVLYAETNLSFKPDGPALKSLDPTPTLSSPNFWDDEWRIFPFSDGELYFVRHPQSLTVLEGSPFTLEAEARGAENTTYTWHQNGLAFYSGRSFQFGWAVPAVSGEYYVVASSGGQSVVSDTATVTVTQEGGPAPAGMARIPAGWFTMGDTHDGMTNAPHVNVYVSEFYMARHQVTWELWNDVRDWAVENGYTDIATGGGKGATHPAHTVNWWDVVKWCNARSQKEGLDPVYRNANGTVFKIGTTVPTANWNANGYRLPTEAEWEKAARGGVSGRRFPWGDTITHSQANYWSSNAYIYDISPTRGFHPTYNDGIWPYTSPVGSFAANGYGLYDMSGNVWEWCWDWYSASTYTEGATDPKGASSGAYRVLRGGSWINFAFRSRAAHRNGYYPDYRYILYGFRPARSSVL